MLSHLHLPHSVMPIFLYPTTVLALDDNPEYLNLLELKLGSDVPVILMSDPKKALHYLNEEYEPSNLIKNIFMNTNVEGLTLADIMNQMYDPKRYQDINTVIPDFAMPEMNGIQFSNGLKDKNLMSIMLTGEAEYSMAKNAFDKQQIKQFLRKDDLEVGTKVLKYIKKNNYDYFVRIAFIVLPHLVKTYPALNKLFDQEVFNFYQESFVKENVCQYYLFDPCGSYILFDTDGNYSFILIRDDKDIAETVKLAKKFGANNSVIQQIETKTKLCSLVEEKDFKNNHINDCLHAIKPVPGSAKYYYAHVRELPHFKLDKNKVVSFNAYLENI